MRKIFNKKFRVLCLCALCFAILIATPIMSAQKSSATAKNTAYVLNLWQIDSFEGGKGSRATYLQNIANEFSKGGKCYLTVTSLTAAAARENLKNGTVPDLISYGAGTFGLDGFIKGAPPYITWCHGGYCVLALDDNADFSDISAENTVVNEGTDNLARVAALFCGLDEAQFSKPTGAYVSLINGKYKYLLGTQRDIYRLKTRGEVFSVKPVTEFNDLYQNISVTSKAPEMSAKAQEFIAYLLKNSHKLDKIGMMAAGKQLHSDEMKIMEGVKYEYRLVSPISERTKEELDGAITNKDLKKLKTLLN